MAEDLLLMYNCQNIMQLPKMNQAILSTSLKRSLFNKHALTNSFATCLLLSGQLSKLTRARKSIAAFQLREGDTVGCMVTIRGNKMYALLDKIVSFVLPRLQSLSVKHTANFPIEHVSADPKALLRRGHPVQSGSGWLKKKEQRDVNFGIPEATLFPEIESLFAGGSSLKKRAVVTTPAEEDVLAAFSSAKSFLPVQEHGASAALAGKTGLSSAAHHKAQIPKSSALTHRVQKQTFSDLQGLNVLFSFFTHKFHLRCGIKKTCAKQNNISNTSSRVFLTTKHGFRLYPFGKGRGARLEELPQTCSCDNPRSSGINKAAFDIRIEKQKDLLFLSAFQYPMHC